MINEFSLQFYQMSSQRGKISNYKFGIQQQEILELEPQNEVTILQTQNLLFNGVKQQNQPEIKNYTIVQNINSKILQQVPMQYDNEINPMSFCHKDVNFINQIKQFVQRSFQEQKTPIIFSSIENYQTITTICNNLAKLFYRTIQIDLSQKLLLTPIYSYNNYRIVNGNIFSENCYIPFMTCDKIQDIVSDIKNIYQSMMSCSSFDNVVIIIKLKDQSKNRMQFQENTQTLCDELYSTFQNKISCQLLFNQYYYQQLTFQKIELLFTKCYGALSEDQEIIRKSFWHQQIYGENNTLQPQNCKQFNVITDLYIINGELKLTNPRSVSNGENYTLILNDKHQILGLSQFDSIGTMIYGHKIKDIQNKIIAIVK